VLGERVSSDMRVLVLRCLSCRNTFDFPKDSIMVKCPRCMAETHIENIPPLLDTKNIINS
jgi:LSD1 subclass zinc finger protein